MRELTVLLVEDNPRDIRLIQRAFNQVGFQHGLHIARDGDEALAYLYRTEAFSDPDTAPRPDLIILDLNLPRTGGHEVLQRCKGDPRLQGIPIVVLTTSERSDDVQRAYTAGANAYLLKPVEFGRFMEVIQNLSAFWLDSVELPPEMP